MSRRAGSGERELGCEVDEDKREWFQSRNAEGLTYFISFVRDGRKEKMARGEERAREIYASAKPGTAHDL